MMRAQTASIDMVVMGASWGGIEAYTRVLGALPERFPVIIMLVQHQRLESGNRLAVVLQGRTKLPVVTPDDKQKVEAGNVYVAPPGYHLLIDVEGRVNYSVSPPVHFCRPAIDELFFSAAHVYGARLMGILLTGANEDGAAGLAYIRQRGGITVAQAPETAEAPVMPQSAIDLNAAMEVLPLEGIAKFLKKQVVGR